MKYLMELTLQEYRFLRFLPAFLPCSHYQRASLRRITYSCKEQELGGVATLLIPRVIK